MKKVRKKKPPIRKASGDAFVKMNILTTIANIINKPANIFK